MSIGLVVSGLWRVVRPPKKRDDESQDLYEWRVGIAAVVVGIGVWQVLHVLWVTGFIGLVTFGYLGSVSYVNAIELDQAKREIIQSFKEPREDRTEQIEQLQMDTKATRLGMLAIRLDQLQDKFCQAESMGNAEAMAAISSTIRDRLVEYSRESHGDTFELLPCL